MMKQITILFSIFLLLSCSRGPHDEYVYIYPCFIDSTHYAFACYYSNVSNGIWGDPSWGDSKSFVTIVDIVSNDSTKIYEDNEFRNIQYLSYNYAESTITIATWDSLLVYDKFGIPISSYYFPRADQFQGWYKPDSLFLAHESYNSYHLKNVKNSNLQSFNAYQGNAQTNKIVFVHGDSLFTYPNHISLKTPTEPKAAIWVNDSILAFCGNFQTTIWVYNLNSNTTSIIIDAYVDMFPTFSLSPDLKWVIYAECNYSGDITPLIIKEIKQ